MEGKLIVIYGVNNVGKTTQAKLLVDRLNAFGRKTSYLKYPIYDAPPSGSLLTEYLRQNNPNGLSPREAQLIYAWNRSQYESALLSRLKDGEWIVAEDYWATGVAWGAAAGVDRKLLDKFNASFYRENLAILLEGRRFASGIEDNHAHEQDHELAEKTKPVFEDLASKNNWRRIKANQELEKVSEDIWAAVQSIF